MSADAVAAAAGGPLAVEVAWSTGPGSTGLLQLQLPAGSTVLDALRAAGLARRLGAEQLDAMVPALWGRVVTPAALLRDGDRLELLRGLVVDPKEARRLRYRRDGVRPKRKLGKRART